MNRMNDLISRQAAIDAVQSYMADNEITDSDWHADGIAYEIKRLPSAQRTGRWKVADLPKGKMKYCSECGFGQYIADERQYNFCPNCGARMEEQE